MNLLDAVEKVEHNENVRKLRGYFLGSIFASIVESEEIKEWTILYYNPQSKTIIDCFVNDKFVTVGEETLAIKEMEEFDLKNVKIGIETVLKTMEKRFKKKALNTLISLHKKHFEKESKTVWTVAYVTPDMSAVSFDIDAASGDVLNEVTTHLLRKV